MQSNRVLLAHRDPAVRELATRALSRISVIVDVADDTAGALSLLAAQPYAVVVMNRDDEVLAAIAAQTPRPMVIVTAPAANALDPEIVSLFVPEPYDAMTLVGVILACVSPHMEPPPATLPEQSGRVLG